MNLTNHPPFLKDLATQVAGWFRQLVDPHVKEIVGHLTGDVLRDWVRQTAAGTEAAKCAVLLDAKQRTVTAFLLTEDDEDVYSARGERLVNVFAAQWMDDRVRGLFVTSRLAFIPVPR